MPDPCLVIRHISKAFPGVKALDNVQFDIYSGEVHALLGENGAGKSTLVKILSGVFEPDHGEIMIQGKTVNFTSTREAQQAGIGIIYQELNLVPDMTAAENIFLGREPRNRCGFIDYKKMKIAAKAELAQLGASINVNNKVSHLRMGEQQIIEIAKALSLHARILIMDEQSSALADTESQLLFAVIRRLQKSGVAIIYISHKLDEIFALAQRVTVLRDGKYIGTRNVPEITSADLICMMVGRKLSELFPKQVAPSREELFRVENLSVKHAGIHGRAIIDNISFSLYRGEILGIAGLMGAGRTELLRTLFGVAPGEVTSGTLSIKGRQVKIRSPLDAVQNRLAFVAEDRKTLGLFPQQNVQTNISISILKKIVNFYILRRHVERTLVQRMMQQLRIRTVNGLATIESLSGGNQQKVILAKWMLTEPEILLLDDPTRGIDVAAKAEIYQLLNQFTDKGMGIVLVSSELSEILAMSDRILVISQGKLTAEFARGAATEQAIMAAATQVK
jgi:ribose transport system ATP-binding protein